MKNSSIIALVTANYTRVNPSEKLQEVRVKTEYGDNGNYFYNVEVASTLQNGKANLTILEIDLYDRSKQLDSHYTIESFEILSMLKQQYLPHLNIGTVSEKVFRPSPCNFTYWIDGEDNYLSLSINEKKRFVL